MAKNKFTSYTFQDNHQEERIPDHAGRTVHVGGVAQNTGHSLRRPEVHEAAVLIKFPETSVNFVAKFLSN